MSSFHYEFHNKTRIKNYDVFVSGSRSFSFTFYIRYSARRTNSHCHLCAVMCSGAGWLQSRDWVGITNWIIRSWNQSRTKGINYLAEHYEDFLRAAISYMLMIRIFTQTTWSTVNLRMNSYNTMLEWYTLNFKLIL